MGPDVLVATSSFWKVLADEITCHVVIFQHSQMAGIDI